MKHIFAPLLCFLVIVFAPSIFKVDPQTGSTSQALAADPGDRDTPTTGATCDFQKFKEDLGARESGGNYGAKNQYGYLGKYQFGHQALVDLGYKYAGGGWTGKNGISSEQAFLSNGPAQETAMNEWSDQMNREIENAGLKKYIGQTMGGCEITLSGMMAGRHLKGIGCSDWATATSCKRGGKFRPGLKAFLESNGSVDPKDGNGTPVSQYVCKFKGYQTPYDNGGGSASGCGGGMPNTGGTGEGHTDTPDGDTDGDGGYGPDISKIDLVSDGLLYNWVASLMLMAEQFTSNMELQMQGIGMLFDAKEQGETQRLLQQKTAEAHKDYQPSEQMCTFGTFARELAGTERSADLTRSALSHEVLQRELGAGDSQGKDGNTDSLSRIKTFRDKFCNPADNGTDGLGLLCTKTIPPEMMNRDIDYTKTIDMPMTLDVNLMDTTTTKDEESIFAMIDYLFMHDPIPRVSDKLIEQQKFQYHYMNLRSIIAMRGIAKNSFSNIVALKTASTEHTGTSAPYLKALMKEMGLAEAEINKVLGKNPSYYAQMEFLTKTIYQNPNFYTNLYDKPANVKRIKAAMEAIKLMNDRDIHDSLLRREMLLSLMLELKLREQARSVYDATQQAIFMEN